MGNIIKEIVVISGKGGTGKTSVMASLACLSDHPVMVDCDVDAADLHLIFSPKILSSHEFRSGHFAVIDPHRCISCGICFSDCRFHAIEKMEKPNGEKKFIVDPSSCEGCKVCVEFCPEKAIDFHERFCGEWMISETRVGPMVHAHLIPGGENSGKLVSLIRKEARQVAEEMGSSLVIVDGPPGIGCPVIGSVTGASLVLAVTEPTVSGEHDLERVLELTRHFQVLAVICVNKWDLNPEITERIETKAQQWGARVVGRIRYDSSFTLAQMKGLSVVETPSMVSEDLKKIWRQLEL